MLTIDCILHFHTVALLSCSLSSCIHLACVFECLFMFELAARILDKINKIYKQECSGVSEETSQILYPNILNILNRCRKNLRQFVQEMGKKNKDQNHSCCKALRVNTQTQKFEKIFENVCILITSTGALSRLISRMA